MDKRVPLGRAIITGIVALLMGIVVVRNAIVAQYAEIEPAIAAKIWPSHPSSQLWSGMTQIGLAARERKPASAATFDRIRSAGIKAPLAAEPFLVRGVQAQVAGNQKLAEQAYLAARLRDGRSIPARYFLAEHYFRAGNAPRGLREIAVLARLVPNGVDSLAPYVASYAKDPRNRRQLLALFQSDHQLEQSVLIVLSTDANNADLVLGLATPASGPQQWVNGLLGALVRAGQYDKARNIWSRIARVAPPAGIFDPGFKGSDAPPPFNWTLTSSTIGLAERQGGGLHVLFYGQDNGVLASQLLMLPPGRYRLAMRVAGEAAQARALRWKISCAGSNASLLELSVADAKRGSTFEVPAGCGAQNLELAGEAPDLPQQVDVTISGLTLVREAASG